MEDTLSHHDTKTKINKKPVQLQLNLLISVYILCGFFLSYPAAGLNMGITSGIVPLEHQFL